MNILYIANDCSLNGANKSLLDTIATLRQDSQLNITVLTSKSGGRLIDVLTEQGVECHTIKFRSATIGFIRKPKQLIKAVACYMLYLMFNFLALIKIGKIIKGKNIDIIHTNSSTVDLGFYASKLYKVKHVWHLREIQHESFPFIGRTLYKKLIRKSDAIVAISQFVASKFNLKECANCLVIHNFVHVPATLTSPTLPIENYFITAGSITPVKGFHLALEGYKIFLEDNPDKRNYKFLVIGNQVKEFQFYYNEIKEYIASNDLTEQVIFMGYQDNLVDIISGATAYIMSSTNEGLGRTTVESQLVKTPVIGYNCGATPEIIINLESGFLCDSPKEQAKQMKMVIEDKELANKVVINGYASANEKFSAQNYISKLQDIYSNLMKEGQ